MYFVNKIMENIVFIIEFYYISKIIRSNIP